MRSPGPRQIRNLFPFENSGNTSAPSLWQRIQPNREKYPVRKTVLPEILCLCLHGCIPCRRPFRQLINVPNKIPGYAQKAAPPGDDLLSLFVRTQRSDTPANRGGPASRLSGLPPAPRHHSLSAQSCSCPRHRLTALPTRPRPRAHAARASDPHSTARRWPCWCWDAPRCGRAAVRNSRPETP